MKTQTLLKVAIGVITFVFTFLFLFCYSMHCKIIALKNNISELDNQTSNLEKAIKDSIDNADIVESFNTLSRRVDEIEKKQTMYQVQNSLKNNVLLHVGEPEASFVDAGLGVLTISLMDVSEYSTGSKIVLRIGNPLAVDINELAMTLRYSDKKIKKVMLNKNFTSGSFTTCEIVLEDVLPSRLQMIVLYDVETLVYTMISESVHK